VKFYSAELVLLLLAPTQNSCMRTNICKYVPIDHPGHVVAVAMLCTTRKQRNANEQQLICNSCLPRHAAEVNQELI
jgi:hypothetical protein